MQHLPSKYIHVVVLNANSAKSYIPKHIPSRGIAGGLVVKVLEWVMYESFLGWPWIGLD